MGEAKRRGTFKERREVAIKRDAKLWKKQKLAEIERRKGMTLEEKTKERKAAEFLAIMYGIAGASVLKYNNYCSMGN